MCTQIRLIKGQLTDWVWANHTISQCIKWGKGANRVIIRSLYPSRIDYVHSNTSIQRKLTSWVWANHTISQCMKWGKGANHGTIIRSLHPSRIDYHYVHSNMSLQRQLTCSMKRHTATKLLSIIILHACTEKFCCTWPSASLRILSNADLSSPVALDNSSYLAATLL